MEWIPQVHDQLPPSTFPSLSSCIGHASQSLDLFCPLLPSRATPSSASYVPLKFASRSSHSGSPGCIRTNRPLSVFDSPFLSPQIFIREVAVFYRTSPRHKLSIVKALQVRFAQAACSPPLVSGVSVCLWRVARIFLPRVVSCLSARQASIEAHSETLCRALWLVAYRIALHRASERSW